MQHDSSDYQASPKFFGCRVLTSQRAPSDNINNHLTKTSVGEGGDQQTG